MTLAFPQVAQPWRIGRGTANPTRGLAPESHLPHSTEPLGPKQRGLLILETELLERAAREKLTLQLWDEDGARSVTIGNVGLPEE